LTCGSSNRPGSGSLARHARARRQHEARVPGARGPDRQAGAQPSDVEFVDHRRVVQAQIDDHVGAGIEGLAGVEQHDRRCVP
jgi:hypothetical protein